MPDATATFDGKPLKARTYIQDADSHDEAGRDSTNSEGFAGYTIPVGEYRIQVRPDGIEGASDRFAEDVRWASGVPVNAASFSGGTT